MEALIEQENLSEALTLAKDRLLKRPFDIDARAFINLINIKINNIEESHIFLHELEKKIIRLSLIYLQAADAYHEKGLNRDAVLCYQKFLSLNPCAEESKEIFQKIALLQGNENMNDESVEEDAECDPGPDFYTITLADLYIKQGHMKMASDILTEIIKREPDNIQAREKLDLVKTVLVSKTAHDNDVVTNNLINILTCWLNNIGKLNNHAT
ncbi:MAG: hypothetical protein ABFD50_04355 [Smithella sp.]